MDGGGGFIIGRTVLWALSSVCFSPSCLLSPLSLTLYQKTMSLPGVVGFMWTQVPKITLEEKKNSSPLGNYGLVR